MFKALLGGSDTLEVTRARFHCAPITGFASCGVGAAVQEVADDEQATGPAPTKATKTASRAR
jgi:hypothetical protein